MNQTAQADVQVADVQTARAVRAPRRAGLCTARRVISRRRPRTPPDDLPTPVAGSGAASSRERDRLAPAEDRAQRLPLHLGLGSPPQAARARPGAGPPRPAAPSEPESVIALEAALDDLTELQRRAILLREWRGLSYREIAEELEPVGGGRGPDLPRAPHARPQPRSPGRRAARHACTVPRCRRAPLRAQVGARRGQGSAKLAAGLVGVAVLAGSIPDQPERPALGPPKVAPPAQVSGPVAASSRRRPCDRAGHQGGGDEGEEGSGGQTAAPRAREPAIAARRDRTGSSRGPGTGRDRPGRAWSTKRFSV